MSAKLEVLVVDSGAIIKGHGLGFHSVVSEDGFYTVQEVLSEIKDSKSRHLLSNLPFELHVRQPSDAAMRAVAEFAKKTGDFSALSLTDLKLLALTYTFEVEKNGKDNIRITPVQSKPIRAAPVKVSKPRAHGVSVKIGESSISAQCGCEGAIESDSVALGSDGEDVTYTHVVEIEDEDEDEEGSANESIAVVEETEETMPQETVAQEAVSTSPEEGSATRATLAVHVPEERLVLVEPVDRFADAEAADTVDPSVTVAPIAIPPPAPLDLPDLTALSLHSSAAPPKLSWASVAASPASGPVALSLPKQSRLVEVLPKGKGMAQSGVEHFGESTKEHASGDTPDTQGTQTYSSRILQSSGGGGDKADEHTAAEDDGLGWINSSNINSVRANGSHLLGSVDEGTRHEEEVAKVACVTTDFSMQNVLIQMNLKVLSVDGLLVRHAKTWVLRCSACFKVHFDMERLFCSHCGVNHLHRIASSIDAKTGVLKLHLKKGFKVSARGKLHPLPKPGQQGKYEGELLLREDQLLSGIWRQKVVKVNRDVRSAFGMDIVSDLGLQLNKSSAIKVGLGRGNPNAVRRRSKKH